MTKPKQESSPSDPTNRSIGSWDVTEWATPAGRRLADAHHRLATRIGSHRALVVSLAIGAGIATLAAVASTRIYDAVADNDGIESADVLILHRAMRLRSGFLDAAAAAIAKIFGPIGLPVLGLTAAAAIGARQRSRTPVILVAAAGMGSLLMTVGGKDVIRRHRPPHRDAIPPYERSPSFPSGHTLNTTVITGVLAYLLILRQRRILPQAATAIGAATTSITVGLSRVLLGAHWFTDVLMGWVSGSGWVALIVTSHRLHLTANRRENENG